MFSLRSAPAFISLLLFSSNMSVAQTPTPPGQGIVPVSVKSGDNPDKKIQLLDDSKFSPLQKQFFHSGKSGAEWLYRMNTVKGRFINGVRPSLKVEMENESFIHQATAALALARAGRVYKDERFSARSSQAILLLLEDTITDPKNPASRYTVLPPQILDRQLSAGLLLLAIHELANPKADLLDAGEQLANFLRSTLLDTTAIDKEIAVEELDGKGCESAVAIAAILKSTQLRPAPWKTDVAKKAIIARWNAWKNQKETAPYPWRILALHEAFKISSEKPYAELAFELTDKLATMQYDQIDPRKPAWYGGMKTLSAQGVELMPGVMSCVLAESFAVACLTAQLSADSARHDKYMQRLAQALQFSQTIQYTESNAIHFAEWFRPRVLGGFHNSPQDGDLRLDYTSHCVAAYALYLQVCAIGS